MMLAALYDYYQRKSKDPDGGLAPEGFEIKEIPFLIVITSDGEFAGFEDTRTEEGKHKRSKRFLVPQGEKKTSGVKASLLWDSLEYVLGVGSSDSEKQKTPERLAQQRMAFRQKLVDYFGESPAHPALRALFLFLDSRSLAQIEQHPLWPEITTSNPFVTIKLQTDTVIIAELPAIREQIASGDTQSFSDICLLTGNKDTLARLHPSIKGVRDAQSAGANIVSFNLDASNSYGKTQGNNAPIGEKAVFAYTTALNHLLGKDSRQKLFVGDSTVVFWAARPGETGQQMENIFGFTFNLPDNPDAASESVSSLYRLMNVASLPEAAGKFFVLGLAPNAARISVRFWVEETISALATRLVAHLEGCNIVRPNFISQPYSALWQLLASTCLANKLDNLPPNMAGDTMHAILHGTPYPAALLQATLRRIRAEREISYPRAALLKAILNRNYPHTSDKEISVALDPDNDNPGYRLGRLFAVLERIQERAQGNLNASIRDRYYGAMSSTPVSVFPILMKLKNHHLAKLENRGEAVNLEKLLAEIIAGIDATIPSMLPLADQARFAVGYYHQRQAFFTKTAENT